MYSAPADVREYTGVRPTDLGLETEQDLDGLLTKWLGQVKDLVDRDRARDFEAEGEQYPNVVDSFTDDQGTSLTGRIADSGQPWTVLFGGAEIDSSGRLIPTSVPLLGSLDGGNADGVVRARVAVTTDEASQYREVGLAFHIQDSNNFWRLTAGRAEGGREELRLVKVVAGVETVVTLLPVAVREDVTYELRADRRSSVIEARMNDRRLIVESSSDLSTATAVGVYAAGGTNSHIDLLRDAPPVSVPPLIDNIALRACANMVGLAILRRDTSIIRIDDFNVELVEDQVLTEGIRKDLDLFPKGDLPGTRRGGTIRVWRVRGPDELAG